MRFKSNEQGSRVSSSFPRSAWERKAWTLCVRAALSLLFIAATQSVAPSRSHAERGNEGGPRENESNARENESNARENESNARGNESNARGNESKQDDHPLVILVVGAEGTPEYGQQFCQWAERWQKAAEQGKAEHTVIGLDDAGSTTDRELLRQRLSKAAADERPLWLVLIGHGTYDGELARFNLRGDDITPDDLSEWLKAREQPTAVINCSSCSGAFLAELSGKDRVVLTATKSGHEYNFSRFGDYLSSAIADPQADLDKDEQTSLLEAYLVAAAKVREFYRTESRLATEHALLDDNGDRLGTPADWFTGLRPTKAAKDGAGLDGTLARRLVLVRSEREEALPATVRQQRDELEQQLAELRGRKAELDEAAYFAELESILVKLARLAQ